MHAEEKGNVTNYADIQNYNVSEKWDSLQWKRLEKKDGVTVLPPALPGLYRLFLRKNKKIKSFPEVCICNNRDTKLEGKNIFNGNEIVLSIGKTKTLRKRLGQHFGNNFRNNRLKTRCIQFFGNTKGIENISLDNLDDYEMYLEYIIIPDWWQRDLLESYGKAIHRCLFDLEIEH